MGFKIVVDSCCDLTGQMLKDPHFVKVPLTIRSNGSSFIDNETFDQADLLWAMKQSDDAPATACPSPQSYLDAYQGPEDEDVYVVTLSALLSGSHNSAEQAKLLMEEDHPNKNVYVFNSCSASSGEVLVALKVRELAESGAPFKHVVREVEQFIYQMQTMFVLETLENLRKNGRLTRLAVGDHRSAEDQAAHGGHAGGGDLQAGTDAVHEAGPVQNGGPHGKRPGPRRAHPGDLPLQLSGPGLPGEGHGRAALQIRPHPHSGGRRHHQRLCQRRRHCDRLLTNCSDGVTNRGRPAFLRLTLYFYAPGGKHHGNDQTAGVGPADRV